MQQQQHFSQQSMSVAAVPTIHRVSIRQLNQPNQQQKIDEKFYLIEKLGFLKTFQVVKVVNSCCWLLRIIHVVVGAVDGSRSRWCSWKPTFTQPSGQQW